MEESGKPNLKSLHPEKLTDTEFAVYSEEFKFVFGDPLCRNIAVSGPYGAGKSSVIEKVKEEYSNLKWITVSLATFGKNETHSNGSSAHEYDSDSNDGTVSKNEEENAIEAEVLRQIIYKINPATTPKSRIHKMQDRGRLKDFGIALYALLFIASCLLMPSCLSNLLSGLWSWFDISVTAVWAIMLLLGLYQIARHNAFSKFVKSFKFLNTEINIQAENQTPYERCVDELVYLLNASGKDVVVFEDLDRFNNLSIFQKMRSLNELVNEDKGDSGTKPLRFIYLIKDSLFDEPRDRTKFFDYVIPVIPYVDPNNALDIFRKALEDVGIEVDNGFLFQLASFIDDPRIVHDIVDEAYHYESTLLKGHALLENDLENLIAILSYKAMYPKDFELLQIDRGYLFEVLNGKRRLIQSAIEEKQNEINDLNKENDNINAQLTINEDELFLLFSYPHLAEQYSYLKSSFKAAATADEILDVIRAHDSNADQYFEQIKTNLQTENKNYSLRLLEIRNSSESRSSANQERINKLREEIGQLQAKTIKQLIDDADNSDSLFHFDEMQITRALDFQELDMQSIVTSPAFPMVRYLVASGWINENYRRYLSRHHGISLSPQDEDFLSSIKQAKSVDAKYKPDQPIEIIRRMDKDMFARSNIRNPWLIAALLKSNSQDKEKVFMDSVHRKGKHSYISSLVVAEQFVPEMFDRFIAYFDNLVIDVLEAGEIDLSQKRAFARKYIAYGGENFQREKGDGAFADWINNVPLLLEPDDAVDTDSLKNGLRAIGYAPNDIDLTVTDSQLIRFIYDEKLFAPDARIVDKLLKEVFGKTDALSTGELATEVLVLNDECISEIVEAGQNEFIESVVANVPISINDSPETILAILNNDAVKDETSSAYISKLDSSIKVPQLADVKNKGDRIALFEAGCVASTMNNIICYYVDSEFCVNEQLGCFLSENEIPDDLKLSTIRALDPDIDIHKFTVGLIGCTTISAERLKPLLFQYAAHYKFLDINDYPEDKIAVLIDTGTISMNEEMLQSVRNHGAELAARFAISNIEEYLDLVSISADGTRTCSFSVDEMLIILDSEADEKKKLQLLREHSGTISLNESYSDSLKLAIVEEHFDDADLQKLADWYDDSSDELKECIRARFSGSIDKVMEFDIGIGWNLAFFLSEAMAPYREKALEFLAWYCEKHIRAEDRSRLIELFKVSGLPEYARLLAGPSSMILDSNLDNRLLNVLEAKGMCGTVKDDVNSEGKRMVYGKGYGVKDAANEA